MDTVKKTVDKPHGKQAAKDTDQQAGEHIGRIVYTGVKTGKTDQRSDHISGSAGFSVKKAERCCGGKRGQRVAGGNDH